MCGIVGIVTRDKALSVEESLRTALSFMKERGPDHSATWVKSPVGLGHTRLSIIDLDPRSHQPFLIEDRVALTFNGEIYNFPELRSELEKKGHQFSTRSDTEVLARGYLEWGTDVVAKLDGMFAFGLYDLVRNQLLLGRDPFGKKPLYLYSSPETLYFCSDIRAIQSVFRSALSLNYQALDYYLTELSVPQPLTIWNEVRQLEPGSYSVVDLSSLECKDTRYWSVPRGHDIFDENEALEVVEKLLLSAIQKRTVSDVPVGCFLSGGVDSGLVVSMLAANSASPVRTFTICLEGHEMDEAPLARQVAERYGTEHCEVVVKGDLGEIARTMSGYCGEPFADSSLIPSFLVCREISKHVTVALSGDGGDEMFGGYEEYALAYRTDRFLRDTRSKPYWKALVLADKAVSRLTRRENLGSFEHYARRAGGERLVRQIGLPLSLRRGLWKEGLLEESKTAELFLQNRWDEVGSEWLSDHLMRASLSTRLVNDYLVKVDRSSMYSSLEVRSPFLDKGLSDIAFRISPELRFKNSTAKYLTKRLAQKYFAPDIFERKKTGFSIPIGDWLREDKFSFVTDTLFSGSPWIYQCFDRAQVERLWAAHERDRTLTHGIWALVCLELWAQETGVSAG